MGEYAHQLASALLSTGRALDDSLSTFLCSPLIKDRLLAQPDLPGATVVDRKVPVSLLNSPGTAREWPPVEF